MGKTISSANKDITKEENGLTESSNYTSYTKKYGKKYSALYQKVMSFITLTATNQIMSHLTFGVFQLLNMASFIKRIWKKLVQRQKYGIDQAKEYSGIGNMQKINGREHCQRSMNANSVGKNILLGNLLGTDSVAIIVEQHGERNQDWIMSSEAVLCAGIPLPPTATQKESGVDHVSIPVYNLEVDQEHEYFANGILVSNCDALRYLCASTFPTGEISSQAEEISIHTRRKLAYGEDSWQQEMFGGTMGYM